MRSLCFGMNLLSGAGISMADTIYQENLVSSGGTVAINTLGWSAYRDNGTDYSAGPVTGATGNQLVTVSTTNAFIASSGAVFSTHFALLSDAGSIDPTAYQSDLTISFMENATDAGTASPEMGWRVLVQVGSTIYASDFVAFSATTTTHDLTVADSIWHVWTGETNLTNGFNIATISGTAGDLAAGPISNIGILAIDGNGNNDRMRLYTLAIEGAPLVDSDLDGLDDSWEILHFRETPQESEETILAKYDGNDDPDGDGYDNEAEETAGTDPNDPYHTPLDADQDGYEDTWELATFGTTNYGPNDDPDDDGYSTAAELTAGTNPSDVSSNPFYSFTSSVSPGTLQGHSADANVQEDGIVFSATATTLQQGGSGSPTKDLATVFVFQLPDFGAVANPFGNSRMEFRFESLTSTPPGVDLYGLGRRASSEVLTGDYHGETSATDPTDAVRLQTNILTTASATGRIATSHAGSVALINYLNTQYEGGIGAGQYVFLRLSTNAPIDAVKRYTLTSADAAAADKTLFGPVITYNFVYPGTTRPFIWVREAEKQAILNKIAQQSWATAIYNAMVARAATPLSSHQTDRDAFIRELPVLWASTPAKFKTIPTYPEQGATGVRVPTETKFNNALDCAVLYYLTGNENYAECAADILHNAIRTLLPVAPSTSVSNGGWIFQDDLLKEARVVGNQLPVVYDFLYNYLQSNQVYDVQTASMVDFNFTNAQSVFRTWYELTRDHGQLVSNWSALMSNGMLQNLLAFDNETERNTALNVYLTTGTSRQQSLATDYQTFTAAGNIWPESLLYAYEVNRIRSNHLMLIERAFPDRNVLASYPQFPANLFRISQLRYPNGEQISFGDMSRSASKEPYFEYELAYQRAKARGFHALAIDLGGRLKDAIQKGLYNRSSALPYESLGLHNEPLQLLWQAATIDEAPFVTEIPRADRVPFAGVALQRNPSTLNNENHGLMGFVGGAAHIHSHACGMAMELYGAGEVMGAKSGTGTYETALQDNYYRLFASNNTVIVNGASRGEGGWASIAINTVQTVAMEPQPFVDGVSADFSFTTSSFADNKGTLAEATQQRTLGIVRTSPKSGFYVDVFRTQSTVTNRTAVTLNGSVTNQYHDYIYRNIGQTGIDLLHDGQPMTLVSQPTRFANDIGDAYDQPGWRYFTNTRVSYPVTGAMRATFTANVGGITRHMDMHMPAVAAREYAQVESPPIRNAPSPYTSSNAPTMVVRQIGEAWNKPFLTVYEPYFAADGPTVGSVETIVQGGVVRGVRVTSEVSGQTMIHHIISQPNANDSYQDAGIGLSFTGRFGIAALMPDGTVRLYVGDGSAMSYRGNTVNSPGGTATQFEAVFTPGQAPVIISNSTVASTPAQLPEVETFARGADGMVTLQSSGLLGTPYRVQASTTLRDDDWTTVAEGIITQSPFTIQLPGQNEPNKFYRIGMP